jgi:hypothetical protein
MFYKPEKMKISAFQMGNLYAASLQAQKLIDLQL